MSNKYFKQILLNSRDKILLEVIYPPKIETTPSGIILSGGEVARTQERNKMYKVHKLHKDYEGELEVGDYVQIAQTAPIAPVYAVENKQFRLTNNPEDVKIIMVRNSSIDFGYREEE